MVSDVYEATCTRGSIFKWQTERSQRVLVDVGDEHTHHIGYNPLITEPQLYLQFGRLQESEEDIRTFAIKYGKFGGKIMFTEEGPHLCWDLIWLLGEIREFRNAIDIWSELSDRVDGELTENMQVQWNACMPLIIKKVTEYVQPMIFHYPRMRSVWFCQGTIPTAWLQLWMSIGQQKPVGQCPECSSLFQKGPKRRYERKFCSQSCKQKSWRRRQK